MAGLKTLAKELQSKGRNGDTILAHINPQEAGILKALGGSGTRNPDTGLPEYFLKKITQPFVQAAKAIQNIPGIKQVSDVSTQAFKPIDQALVGLDKTVGKSIPGGWETVGQVALSAMGAPMPIQVGYGAARGAGILRPGSSLQKADLKGAVIGGATAYATAELGEYMRGAAPPGTETTSKSLTDAVQEAAKEPIGYTLDASGDLVPQFAENVSVASNTYGPMGEIVPVGSTPPPVPTPTVNYQPPPFDPNYNEFAGLRQPITSSLGRGEFGEALGTLGKDISGAAGSAIDKGIASVQDLGTNVQDFGKAAIDPGTYTGALDRGMTNAGQTFSGIKNLATGPATLKATTAATGINPINMAGMVLFGESTLAGMEEQRKYLEEAKRANAISQAEYDRAMASIISQRDYAADVVSKNQFNPNPSRDVSIGETFYGRSGEGENLYGRAPDSGSMLYAMGGSVDDELGGDYSAMGMDQGNLQKGLFGLGYAAGGMPNLALSRLSQPAFNEGAVGGMQQFAEGGTPRFLSGGGDGMSDSIKATINDNQPARLADGEFVIPADVVSHLGNGSSKAGAKQLYSMMDKIRKARTGRKSQGKQINPRKYLPA
jgi:hypothetical protein